MSEMPARALNFTQPPSANFIQREQVHSDFCRHELSESILGTYCGTDRPDNVETYSNEVKLTFHTDGNSDHNTGCVESFQIIV